MADPAPIEMQRSSDETEGAISNGAIAEAATTLTADDILLLADEPAGSLRGPHWVEPPVLARGLEGPVSAQPCRSRAFRRRSLPNPICRPSSSALPTRGFLSSPRPGRLPEGKLDGGEGDEGGKGFREVRNP